MILFIKLFTIFAYAVLNSKLSRKQFALTKMNRYLPLSLTLLFPRMSLSKSLFLARKKCFKKIDCFKIHPRFLSDYKTHLSNILYCVLPVSVYHTKLFLFFLFFVETIAKCPTKWNWRVEMANIQGQTWKLRRHMPQTTISSYCNIILHTT